MTLLRHVRRHGLRALAVVLLVSSPAAADQFRGLNPGAFDTLRQTIPVNVVFVGYDRSAIDLATFQGILPARYVPLVRYPQFYGLAGRDMGLDFRFQYKFEFTTRRFDDAFFQFLARAGTPGPATPFQVMYNAEDHNVLDVTGDVLYIDGPTVERYLQDRDGRRREGYTIYFINWYGRADFRFHVYTKTDQPDPDTGYNFGVLRGSRKMIAWGGTTSRTWFYDLSAGPEAWTNNWIVDDKATQTENHMPPIWEYSATGYRPPGQLSFDLSLVARFVGIDLLFTTSPLYDPLVTSPDIAGGKVAHVAILEDDPAADGTSFFNGPFMAKQMRQFQPYYPWKVGTSDNPNPLDAGAKAALTTFTETFIVPGCWEDFGTTFAQPFCYFDQHLDDYVPDYGRRNYVGEIFAFNTTDAGMGIQSGLLGFADDNWIDGTQSYVFMFNTPGYRDLGFGFTATGVHEFGHHLGMSHPHDGYDSELGLDFGAEGDFEFAWSGDESDTVMQYLSVSNGFSRFDRDNLYRWETAGYLNWANALAADVLASNDARRVWLLLAGADLAARGAKSAFNNWDYLGSAASARLAYTLVAAAAGHINASSPVLTAARRALPGRRHPDGCRIRYARF